MNKSTTLNDIADLTGLTVADMFAVPAVWQRRPQLSPRFDEEALLEVYHTLDTAVKERWLSLNEAKKELIPIYANLDLKTLNPARYEENLTFASSLLAGGDKSATLASLAKRWDKTHPSGRNRLAMEMFTTLADGFSAFNPQLKVFYDNSMSARRALCREGTVFLNVHPCFMKGSFTLAAETCLHELAHCRQERMAAQGDELMAYSLTYYIPSACNYAAYQGNPVEQEAFLISRTALRNLHGVGAEAEAFRFDSPARFTEKIHAR